MLRLWKLRKKAFLFRRKKKNENSSIAAILNVTRAFSATIFLHLLFVFLRGLKKGKGFVYSIFLVYGRFLVTSIASTAPIMIITIMIATPMYSSVVCVATPLSGVAVGAGVACALCTVIPVSSLDPQ